jgi:hypothetical protein
MQLCIQHDIPADNRILLLLSSSRGDDLQWTNCPIACSSKMITCLVDSVTKAKLEATFQSVQLTVQHRKKMLDFGYPQPAKLTRIDNTVHQFHKILLPNLIIVSAFFCNVLL